MHECNSRLVSVPERPWVHSELQRLHVGVRLPADCRLRRLAGILHSLQGVAWPTSYARYLPRWKYRSVYHSVLTSRRKAMTKTSPGKATRQSLLLDPCATPSLPVLSGLLCSLVCVSSRLQTIAFPSRGPSEPPPARCVRTLFILCVSNTPCAPPLLVLFDNL